MQVVFRLSVSPFSPSAPRIECKPAHLRVVKPPIVPKQKARGPSAPSTILDLPMEVLQAILLALDPPINVLRVMATCQLLRSVAMQVTMQLQEALERLRGEALPAFWSPNPVQNINLNP